MVQQNNNTTDKQINDRKVPGFFFLSAIEISVLKIGEKSRSFFVN